MGLLGHAQIQTTQEYLRRLKKRTSESLDALDKMTRNPQS